MNSSTVSISVLDAPSVGSPYTEVNNESNAVGFVLSLFINYYNNLNLSLNFILFAVHSAYYFLFHLLAFNANIARFLVSGFFEWVNSSVVLPVLFFVALNFPRFAGFICIPDLP
nr:MAG TPA: hypothetical protein [Caudoviricetes sp.]